MDCEIIQQFGEQLDNILSNLKGTDTKPVNSLLVISLRYTSKISRSNVYKDVQCCIPYTIKKTKKQKNKTGTKILKISLQYSASNNKME